VRLSAPEVRTVYWCFSVLIRGRRHDVPRPVADLYDRLDAEIRLVSRPRHGVPETGCGQQQSDAWIGCRETAEILKLSKRQVQRIASDLGGQLISGRYVFDRDTVHAERRYRDG
jgi:hypothetical protein